MKALWSAILHRFGRRARQLKRLERCGYFDGQWYLRTYTDVAADLHWQSKPAEHYLRFGSFENRDPGPAFSCSGYRLTHRLTPQAEPLTDAINKYGVAGTTGLTQFAPITVAAERAADPALPWMLVCAHSGGPQLFGAERSLLDVLQGLSQLSWNLLVVLPAICSAEYLASISAYATRVVVMPYTWWRLGKPTEAVTVDLFKQLMAEYAVRVCYCNTLVLHEALVAARLLAIPTVVHVRELPEADPDLCLRMNAKPQQIRQHLLEWADYCIANSACVASYINAPARTTVIANAVDTSIFAETEVAQLANNQLLSVGLISSNLPKKGLTDFGRLAALLAPYQGKIRLCLIGPENEHSRTLRQACTDGDIPDMIEFAGYVPSVTVALEKLHIVLNLSHFQESFGRTVLEAMAAGRVVVCYDWGALTELIEHNNTGILIPFAQVDAVAKTIVDLYNTPARIPRLGNAARTYAVEHYGKAQLTAKLQHFFSNFSDTARSR